MDVLVLGVTEDDRETSHAYQVERSKVDQILLDHARHMGVDVREEHAVTDVIEDEGGRVCGVS